MSVNCVWLLNSNCQGKQKNEPGCEQKKKLWKPTNLGETMKKRKLGEYKKSLNDIIEWAVILQFCCCKFFDVVLGVGMNNGLKNVYLEKGFIN